MLVDAVIIVLLLAIVIRGRETGLVRQLGSAVGFVAGLFAGAALQPYALQYADTTLSRALMALSVTIGCALALANLGEFFGSLVKARIRRWMQIDNIDAIGGSLAGVVAMLAAVWLVTPILGGLPDPTLQRSLKNSYIVSRLNQTLPSAPEFISSIDRLINPNGFPDVFAGLERKPVDPNTPLPSLGEMQAAVQQARTSVVKLEGRGCGGTVDGSGFVVAENTVITNAHVVAGVRRPFIIDANGQHSATVIWFDPDLDMAVLRASGLAGPPLALDATPLDGGTPAVVVGYPGGGDFTASPATILDRFTATGRDIYGRGSTERSIYEVRADIIPGNSGGPMISKDGKVVGLVFAESTTYEDIGYTLTLQPVIDGLQKAQAHNQAVGTGACAG